MLHDKEPIGKPAEDARKDDQAKSAFGGVEPKPAAAVVPDAPWPQRETRLKDTGGWGAKPVPPVDGPVENPEGNEAK